jgi:hypothetical protein
LIFTGILSFGHNFTRYRFLLSNLKAAIHAPSAIQWIQTSRPPSGANMLTIAPFDRQHRDAKLVFKEFNNGKMDIRAWTYFG